MEFVHYVTSLNWRSLQPHEKRQKNFVQAFEAIEALEFRKLFWVLTGWSGKAVELVTT